MKLGRKDYTISVKTGTDANKAKFKKECVQGEIYHATDTGFFYIAEVTAGASDATLSKFGAPAFTNQYSVDFDGTNDFVDCGNISVLSNASSLTMSGWFNFNTLNTLCLTSGSSLSNRIYFYVTGTGSLGIYFDGYNPLTSSINLSTSQWYHLALVKDGNGSNNLKLFINGSLSDGATGSFASATSSTAGDDASYDVVGNTEGSTIYFEHEIGVNQTTSTGISAIPTSIISGDYDITQKVIRGAATNMADLRGDGEFIMRISRIIPDFISQEGNTVIQLDIRNYPNDASTSSPLGPFTITSSTDKIDTRARGRAIALNISSTGINQNWKLGTFRLDIQSGGRR